MDWKDFIGNWKTTLAGLIGATSTIVISFLYGEMDLKAFILAMAIAILGVLSKDGDKTGTRANPR